MTLIRTTFTWIIVFAIFGTFSFCSKKSSDVQPGQLLLNANMEAGGLAPDIWFKNAGTSGIYTTEWSTAKSSSASHSLKISSTSIGAAKDIAFWAQFVSGELPVEKNLKLTVKIKGENISGDGVAIAIRADNAEVPGPGGTTIVTTEGVTSITGTFDWTTYTIEMPSLRTDVKFVNIYFFLLQKTTGTVYFDDAVLVAN